MFGVIAPAQVGVQHSLLGLSCLLTYFLFLSYFGVFLQALADVLAAVTLTRGAAGVTQVLDQTKSQFAERQRQAAAEAAEEDRLRAQFAQRKQELRTAVESLAEDTCEQLAEASSLLRDHGKSNLLLEAFTNGSSVVCTRCEMLVKRERWEMHNTRWCSRLADGGSGHREEA